MLICRFGELLPHELELLVALLQLEGLRLDRRYPCAEIRLRLKDAALQPGDLIAASADVLLGLATDRRGFLSCLLDGSNAGRVGFTLGFQQGFLGAGFDALRIGGRHGFPDQESRGDPHREGDDADHYRDHRSSQHTSNASWEKNLGRSRRRLGAGVREGGRSAIRRWRCASHRSSIFRSDVGQLAHRASWDDVGFFVRSSRVHDATAA